MTYVLSDIHGCYEKFIKILKATEFGRQDIMYILGDAIDRGNGGIKILMSIMKAHNIIMLMGNHEYAAQSLLCDFEKGGYQAVMSKRTRAWAEWQADGGAATFREYAKLGKEDRKAVLKYMQCLPYYAVVETGIGKFFLSHTVPGKEEMSKKNRFGFLIGEPDYDLKYSDDVTIVTGHTPTGFIDRDYTGRIWKGNNHVAVDCGAVFGNPLGCICLDTMEEFYAD